MSVALHLGLPASLIGLPVSDTSSSARVPYSAFHLENAGDFDAFSRGCAPLRMSDAKYL